MGAAEPVELLGRIDPLDPTTYIVKIDGEHSGIIGAALSNSSCDLYACNETFKRICTFPEQNSSICDIKLCPTDERLVYVGYEDGSIKLWDSRCSQQCVSIFEENPDTREFVKPLASFDVSHDNKILCGGSELTQSDAFLLFWDIRNIKLLGGYWNSHFDDIVQVRFNKMKPHSLITGSIDGLLNIFDITESTEDDALQYSLNVGCAVDKIKWLPNFSISCLTQNIDLQIWNSDTADKISTFSRKEIAKAMKNTDEEDCYVVDVCVLHSNEICLLVGSYANESDALEMINISSTPKFRFSFNGNKQIVRCCWYDKKNNILSSGGEHGILNFWRLN